VCVFIRMLMDGIMKPQGERGGGEKRRQCEEGREKAKLT
jgi:hypothetical protein